LKRRNFGAGPQPYGDAAQKTVSRQGLTTTFAQCWQGRG
jgi:hypothetical protein